MSCLFAHFDGHAQFRPVYNGGDSTDNINGISFLTPSTGFVAFSKFIGFTQDSGRTYVKRTINLSNVDYNGYSVGLTFGFTPRGVVAFSADSLLAFGDYSFEPSILFSANQGQTWKLVFHRPINPNASVLSNGITDMQFPGNGSTGFALHNEEVVRTTDRGQSWLTVLSAPNQTLSKLSFPSLATGFASGGSIVYKGTASGTTWSNVSPGGFPYSPDFNNVFFNSATTGYVMESGTHAIYRTTDGAATWKLMNDPGIVPIAGNDLYFTNDSVGYVATHLYQVWKTTNYGKTWEPCKNSTPYQFLFYGMNALFFLGNQMGWAGGDGEYLLLTTNGGPTLPKAYFKIDTSLLSVTDSVKLINYSNTGYQYKWYRNDTLIGVSYNLEYAHAIFRLKDTVKLIVGDGTDADTLINYISFLPPVLIYSFNPPGGATGSTVTLKGTGFTGATAVNFGGIPAAGFTVVSDSQIVATIGKGASGTITVTTPNGVGSISGFVYSAPPNIDLPVQVADSIVCKTGAVSLTIQNTETGVRYELLDSLGNSYGSIDGNGGTVTLVTSPVSVSGNYKIGATRINNELTATFTNQVFLFVEHPMSGFGANKINIAIGETVDYYNRSTGSATFRWLFNQDASIAGSSQPVVAGVSYGSAGLKTLELISTSANGCSDTSVSNAVFVYPGNPSATCFADNIDDSDSYTLYQGWNDLSPGPNDGFMICASGNQSKLSGRAGVTMNLHSNSSFVYSNYSSSGVLRWADYGSGSIASSTMDSSGNIYLTGIINSASFFHFSNGDSMQIYVAESEKEPVWSKDNGYIMKLDANGNYLWHTVLYDPSPLYQGYPVEGGAGNRIRVFGDRIIVLGTFLANLSYVRNGVQTSLYSLPNSIYANYNENNFVLSIKTDGTLDWSSYIRQDFFGLSNMGMDSHGNAYITGSYDGSMTLYDASSSATSFSGAENSTHGFILKFDPAGHLAWSTHLDNNYYFQTASLNDITVDPIGNSYVIGSASLGDTSQYFVVNNSDKTTKSVKLSGWILAKFDPNGILQWAEGTNPGEGGTGLSVSLKGNTVYAFGSHISNTVTDFPVKVTSVGGGIDSFMISGTEMFLARYTTDGVLQRINRSGANVGGYFPNGRMFIDSHGNMVLSGQTTHANGGGDHWQIFGEDLITKGEDVFFAKLDSSLCGANSPAKTVDAGPNRSICPGDSVVLGGAIVDSVYWTSNPAGLSSHSKNPVVYPAQTTTYFVTTVSSSGSVSHDSTTITVIPTNNYYGGSDTTICVGHSDTLGFKSTADVSGNRYAWTSNPIGFNSGLANPVVTPQTSTTYYVSVGNSMGCASQDTVTITVKANPIPAFSVMDTAICIGGQVSIGQIDSLDNWSWISQPAGFMSLLPNPVITVQATTSYYAAITNKLGCTGTDTVIVTAKPLPPKPTITQVGPYTLFSSAVSGNQWYIDTLSVIAGEDSVSYTPAYKGSYSVRVTEDGCVSPFSDKYVYTIPVIVPPAGDSSYITLSPNPVTSYLLIQFKIPGVTNLQVEIIDLSGRISIHQNNVTTGSKIYLTDFAKGAYAVRITDDSGKVRILREIIKL